MRIDRPASAILLAAVCLTGATPAARSERSTREIVEAASAYVGAYQERLTSVVAEEAYVQRIVARVPHDAAAPVLREMSGEIFFVFAHPQRQWMALRDVAGVDGVDVIDRGNIRQALATRSAGDVAAALRQSNARFNLGRVTRTVNEPTFALLVLDGRHRDRFSFGRRRHGGVGMVTLTFKEQERPTLIRDATGAPVFARGELTVDPRTGAVTRSVVSADGRNVRTELTTEYGVDDRLGLLVPRVFRERYTFNVQGSREEVAGEAGYSNYRRFETGGRVR